MIVDCGWVKRSVVTLLRGFKMSVYATLPDLR